MANNSHQKQNDLNENLTYPVNTSNTRNGILVAIPTDSPAETDGSVFTTFLSATEQSTSLDQPGFHCSPDFDWTSFEIPLYATAIALYILIATLGLGNIMTLHFTVRQQRLKRPFNPLVGAMAIGDLILSDFVALLEIYDLAEMGISNAGMHKRFYVWCTVKVSRKQIPF